MPGFAIFIALVGAMVGSFVNVLAIRVPAGDSMAGRSHCTSCGTTLGAVDLVPVVSWAWLRGRCRHCSASVSGSYAVGEGVCGAVFLVLAIHFGPHLELVPYLFLASGLLALSIVDLRTFRLPDRIVGPLTILVVIAFAVVAAANGDGEALARSVEAGLLSMVSLGLLHFAYPRGLGFGDVKLAFVLGMATGWVSWGAVGLAIFFAALLGTAVGVISAVATGEPVRGRRLPFGPFLATGALLSAVVGPSLLDWYTGLLR